MNYIDKIADQIGERCGMSIAFAEERRLLRLYAIVARSSGVATTSEDVHDAWACWRMETDPAHECLVPFYDLSSDVQQRDDKYRDAIIATVKDGLV